jgi:hypothetical protein
MGDLLRTSSFLSNVSETRHVGIAVLPKLLEFKGTVEQDTRNDATMGKAFCLQRLMKYHDARLAFLDVETERACLGAATCSLVLFDRVTRKEPWKCFEGIPRDTQRAWSAKGC